MRIEKKTSKQTKIDYLSYGDVFYSKGEYFIASNWCFNDGDLLALLGVNLQDGTCQKFKADELVELIDCHLVLD